MENSSLLSGPACRFSFGHALPYPHEILYLVGHLLPAGGHLPLEARFARQAKSRPPITVEPDTLFLGDQKCAPNESGILPVYVLKTTIHSV